MSFEEFILVHEPQLKASCVPEHLWPKLHDKLTNEVFDAGDYFQMVKQDENGDVNWQVISTQTIITEDPEAIFLIDHAWTFRNGEARYCLYGVPGLLERMASLMDIDQPGKQAAEVVSRKSSVCNAVLDRNLMTEAVLQKLWNYVQTYSFKSPALSAEEKTPVWYILDEFGSRIPHNEEQTNVRIIPFYYAPTQISFGLLFPIKDIGEQDEITRNFVEPSPVRNPEWKEFYLLPWFDQDFSHLPQSNIKHEDLYYQKDRRCDILPTDVHEMKSTADRILKVFADNDQLVTHLKHPSFELTQDINEADVLWLRDHFHDYKRLAEKNVNCFVNQFPNESVLTVKDLFSAVVNDSNDDCNYHTLPSWFPITYNLKTELPQFVSTYQNRQKKKLDNHWIIKPWNLARALDTHVTDNLSQIIRLTESGPKIASKYVERPVLICRADTKDYVKFDLRFIVVVRSVKPLEAYLYNRFWLRFALKPFLLEYLDDYDTHFTVFNYDKKKKILQMECAEFIERFEQQYPGHKWSIIEQKLHKMLRDVLETVSTKSHPRSLVPNPQSRAMYGVDAMLKWKTDPDGGQHMEPVFLEANFMPDCDRACEYYEDFADTVFDIMFLDSSMHSDAANSLFTQL